MDIPIPKNPYVVPASYLLVLIIGIAIGWVGDEHYHHTSDVTSTAHAASTNKDGSTNLGRTVGGNIAPTDVPKNNTPAAGINLTIAGGAPVVNPNVHVDKTPPPKKPHSGSQSPVVASNAPTQGADTPDDSSDDNSALRFSENPDGSLDVSPGLLHVCARILSCPTQHLVGTISTDKSGQTDVTVKDLNGNAVTGTVSVPKTVKVEEPHPVLLGVSYGSGGMGLVVGYQFKRFPITAGVEVHKDDTQLTTKNNIDSRVWATWSF